jgi:hypothetical protein
MGLTRTSKSKSKGKVSTARRRERNFAWTPSARDRFARAESLALTIWPLDKLTLEVEATDAIVTEARTPRALWWGTLQLFGDDDGEAFNTIFQCARRKV